MAPLSPLIKELMPEPDIVMRHVRGVNAPPERVFAALGTTDFGKSGLISLLFAIRGIPAFIAAPREAAAKLRKPKSALTLDQLKKSGFGLVAERPGEEIVLGVTGRFWVASPKLKPATREHFKAGPPPGEVLVAWNFHVEPAPKDHARISTETRIKAADVDTRLTFQRYWLMVHPGSAMIRRSMLAAIAREASRPA
jgi:hypothetical protein